MTLTNKETHKSKWWKKRNQKLHEQFRGLKKGDIIILDIDFSRSLWRFMFGKHLKKVGIYNYVRSNRVYLADLVRLEKKGDMDDSYHLNHITGFKKIHTLETD